MEAIGGGRFRNFVFGPGPKKKWQEITGKSIFRKKSDWIICCGQVSKWQNHGFLAPRVKKNTLKRGSPVIEFEFWSEFKRLSGVGR